MDLGEIQSLFSLAIPALCALWAVRLWRLGLATQYRLLMTFLIGSVIVDLSGFVVFRVVGGHSQIYIWFWPISRLISSTLSFLVLLQVYQRLVESYAGFQKLGQVVLYVAVGGASAVMLGSIFLGPGGNLQDLAFFWILEERGVHLALTCVTLALLGFAVFFRLLPPRNVVILFAVFGLLFTGQTFAWALRDFFGWDFRGSRLLVSSTVYCICFLVGAVTFSRVGEQVGYLAHTTLPGGGNGSGGSSRLEEINEALLNVFRL